MIMEFILLYRYSWEKPKMWSLIIVPNRHRQYLLPLLCLCMIYYWLMN